MFIHGIAKIFSQTFSTVVHFAEKLANISCNSSWICSIFNVRRGESKVTKVHHKARKVWFYCFCDMCKYAFATLKK